MRKLLANASTTPSSAGAGDLLLPLLRNFPPGWLPLSDATAHRNPPRSKWTRARKTATTRRRARTTARGATEIESVRGCALEVAGVARALRAVAEAAVQASKEYQDALLGGAANHGGSVGGSHRSSKAPTGLLEANGRGGPLPTFQRWGTVGVLNVSVACSQVDCALGGRDAGRRLLSGDAWAWLEAFFRTPEIGWQVRNVSTSRSQPLALYAELLMKPPTQVPPMGPVCAQQPRRDLAPLALLYPNPQVCQKSSLRAV